MTDDDIGEDEHVPEPLHLVIDRLQMHDVADTLANYRSLLGEYLTQWLGLEDLVNLILTKWFDREERRAHELHDWVIVELTMERRINILSLISDSERMATDGRAVLSKLRRANTRRNDFAHRRPVVTETAGFRVGRPGKLAPVTALQLRNETLDLIVLGGEIGLQYGPACGLTD